MIFESNRPVSGWNRPRNYRKSLGHPSDSAWSRKKFSYSVRAF